MVSNDIEDPKRPTCLAGAFAANLIDEAQRFDITRHACPGAGACGGMYTANTMASAIEALGMSLPYSSSVPAEDPLKKMECRLAGRQVYHWHIVTSNASLGGQACIASAIIIALDLTTICNTVQV